MIDHIKKCMKTIVDQQMIYNFYIREFISTIGLMLDINDYLNLWSHKD